MELSLGNLLFLHGQRQAMGIHMGIHIGALATRRVFARHSGRTLVNFLAELIAHNCELDKWVIWISATVTG